MRYPFHPPERSKMKNHRRTLNRVRHLRDAALKLSEALDEICPHFSGRYRWAGVADRPPVFV